MKFDKIGLYEVRLSNHGGVRFFSWFNGTKCGYRAADSREAYRRRNEYLEEIGDKHTAVRYLPPSEYLPKGTRRPPELSNRRRLLG